MGGAGVGSHGAALLARRDHAAPPRARDDAVPRPRPAEGSRYVGDVARGVPRAASGVERAGVPRVAGWEDRAGRSGGVGGAGVCGRGAAGGRELVSTFACPFGIR